MTKVKIWIRYTSTYAEMKLNVCYVSLQKQTCARNTRRKNAKNKRQTLDKPSNFTCVKRAGDESEKILSKLQNLPLASLSTAAHVAVSPVDSFRSLILKGSTAKKNFPLPEPASLQAPAHAEQLAAPPAEILSARGGSLTAVGS